MKIRRRMNYFIIILYEGQNLDSEKIYDIFTDVDEFNIKIY
jgi:hypothetical protein